MIVGGVTDWSVLEGGEAGQLCADRGSCLTCLVADQSDVNVVCSAARI